MLENPVDDFGKIFLTASYYINCAIDYLKIKIASKIQSPQEYTPRSGDQDEGGGIV